MVQTTYNIEKIISKYKDLGNLPESLLLIDKYDFLFKLVNTLKKYDNSKRSKSF